MDDMRFPTQEDIVKPGTNHSDRLNALRIPRDSGAAPTWHLPKPPGWMWAVCGILLGAVATLIVTAQLKAVPKTATAAETARPEAAATQVPAGDQILVASGYVVAGQRATVASEVTGRIVSLSVKEGEIVHRGQVLATLNSVPAQASLSRTVATARAAHASVDLYSEQAQQAERDLARYETLARKGYAGDAALELKRSAFAQASAQLATARETAAAADAAVGESSSLLRSYVVVAPFGGQVSSLNAQIGEIISPMSAGGGFTRTGICTIVNLDTLGVEVDVGEALIGKVRRGQPARIELDAYPGVRFDARVDTIFPTADMQKSTIRVRISFLHADPRVLPEMAAKVSFLR